MNPTAGCRLSGVKVDAHRPNANLQPYKLSRLDVLLLLVRVEGELWMYLLANYPTRAGPLLVIICAFRGIISFGTSYGTAPFIASHGYDGTFGTFAALTVTRSAGHSGILPEEEP